MSDPSFGRPAEVRPAQDLLALFVQVNSLVESGEASERSAALFFHRAGQALLRAKQMCPHGHWLATLQKHAHTADLD